METVPRIAAIERLTRLRSVAEWAVRDWRAGNPGEAMESLEDLLDELFTPPPRLDSLVTAALDD